MTGMTGGGFPGPALRDRPFIDDRPTHKYGWEGASRWGSQPFRQFGSALARGVARVTRFFKGAVARGKRSGMALFLMQALLIGASVASLESCSDARAIVAAPPIDHMLLGFGLDSEGRVSAGCTARTFSLGDPIHLSMQVRDAAAGSVLNVTVRDVVTHRVAWSEARPLTAGGSFVTFEIGKKLPVGRYRADSAVGGVDTLPQRFVVHERRPGVR
jgi:hypothetical protein